MDALHVDLVAQIIRLIHRDSKKHLSSAASSWQVIAEEYFVDFLVNSTDPTLNQASESSHKIVLHTSLHD
uniref:F-box domain-containing protein n=1 Tax=Steinernema glaseri TaxID=37863 RepID=A0A1I7ZF33_9BILA